MHRVRLDFKFDSEEIAKTVWRSLVPESSISLRGVKTSVELSDSTVVVDIEARDESSLRASLYSLIKLVHLVIEILDVG